MQNKSLRAMNTKTTMKWHKGPRAIARWFWLVAIQAAGLCWLASVHADQNKDPFYVNCQTYNINHGNYTFPTSNPDWMSYLPDDLPISALSVPGTHDTMTFGYDSLGTGDKYVTDQTLPLNNQLDAGIRFIDIRCVQSDEHVFKIYHGSYYLNAHFDDVLLALNTFLAAHPNEVIFMQGQKEPSTAGNDQTAPNLANTFDQTFVWYRDQSGMGGRIWKGYPYPDLIDANALATTLKSPTDPVSTYVRSNLKSNTRQDLDAWKILSLPANIKTELMTDLNALAQTRTDFWDTNRFAGVRLSSATQSLLNDIQTNPFVAYTLTNINGTTVEILTDDRIPQLNQLLLIDAYPNEVSDILFQTPFSQMPKLGDVRGKIIVWNNGGTGWPDPANTSEYRFTPAPTQKETQYQLRDNYSVNAAQPNDPNNSDSSFWDKKFANIKAAQCGPYTNWYETWLNGYTYRNVLTSALPFMVAGGVDDNCTDMCTCDANGLNATFVGMNEHALSWLQQNGSVNDFRKCGAVVMDYPGWKLIEQVIAHNPIIFVNPTAAFIDPLNQQPLFGHGSLNDPFVSTTNGVGLAAQALRDASTGCAQQPRFTVRIAAGTYRQNVRFDQPSKIIATGGTVRIKKQ